MLPEQRKYTMWVFLAIYVIFGAILVYLMFFNTGIRIIEELEPGTNIKHLFIENQSSRTILNISVSYRLPGSSESVAIAELGELKSGERYEIMPNFPDVDTIEIIAGAPFHQTIAKQIAVRFGETGLKYNFKVPNRVFVGGQFRLVFEACNFSENPIEAVVEERHAEDAFGGGNVAKEVVIAADSCTDLEYMLTPLKEGKTTVFFNVKVQNISDKPTITIQVEE